MMKYFVLSGTVAFVVLGELAIAVLEGPSGLTPADFFDTSIWGMMSAHAGLIAIWVALVGKAGPWRLAAAILALVLWMHVVVEWWSTWDMEDWCFLLLTIMGLASVLLMFARLLGVELTNVRDKRSEPDDPDHRWLQFTLRSMLSWTTALAVIMATYSSIVVYSSGASVGASGKGAAASFFPSGAGVGFLWDSPKSDPGTRIS